MTGLPVVCKFKFIRYCCNMKQAGVKLGISQAETVILVLGPIKGLAKTC